MIHVQQEDFDVSQELAKLTADNHAIGGVAVFVGLVRDMAGESAISAMTLEHYPAMTEKMLAEIEQEARTRWPLEASLVIHRYGRLERSEEHTSELQSLMRISYAVFCLKKKHNIIHATADLLNDTPRDH